jgi:hypothetical protein
MKFSEALLALEAGRRIRREAWHKDNYVSRLTSNTMVGVDDILADDWIVRHSGDHCNECTALRENDRQFFCDVAAREKEFTGSACLGVGPMVARPDWCPWEGAK